MHKGGWDYETPREILRGYWDALVANSPVIIVGVLALLALYSLGTK